MAASSHALSRCLLMVLCAALPPLATAAKPTSADPSMVELDRMGRRIAANECARPQRVEIKPVRRANDAKPIGQIRTLTAAGCRIVVYRNLTARARTGAPLEVELQAGHRRLAAEITVGATTDSVLAALGVPYRMQGQSMIYALDDDDPDEAFVAIRLKDGKVESLAWKWQGRRAPDQTGR